MHSADHHRPRRACDWPGPCSGCCWGWSLRRCSITPGFLYPIDHALVDDVGWHIRPAPLALCRDLVALRECVWLHLALIWIIRTYVWVWELQRRCSSCSRVHCAQRRRRMHHRWISQHDCCQLASVASCSGVGYKRYW